MEEFSAVRFKTNHFEQTTDIPDWFDLNNYTASNTLTNKQWRHQLTCRFLLLYQVTEKDDFDSDVYDTLKEIRLKGIPNSIDIIHDDTEIANSDRAPYSEIKHYAIRPLTLGHIAFNGRDLWGPLLKDKLKVPDEYLDDPWVMPFDIYRKDHDDDPGDATLAYLVIDLKLPLSDIVTEVKKFIPDYRKLLGVNPNSMVPSDSTIGKLTNYKILAFLDLYIWELENKKRIKKSRSAGALFPDHMYGEIDLDQIIKPFAMKVLDISFLSRLYKY